MPTFISQAWQAYAAQVAALGREPDLLILAARRFAWTMAGLDTANAQIKPILPTGRPVVAPSLPVTLGAGAEDAVLLLSSTDVDVLVRPPVIKAIADFAGSANRQIRFQGYCYLACLPNRQPNAVAAVRGSGLTTPTFP